MTHIREQIIEEIPDLIWAIGDGRGRNETYDRMLERAAQKSGISYWRLWNYWHRKVRKPLAEEYLVLKQWSALGADAETNRLLAKSDRLAKDAADARTNTSVGTDRSELHSAALFGACGISV